MMSKTQPRIVTLPISKIRLEKVAQPREHIDEQTIQEYRERFEAGNTFPPVVVFFDGTDYWAEDGFHRLLAAPRAGRVEIPCEVHQGTLEDAR